MRKYLLLSAVLMAAPLQAAGISSGHTLGTEDGRYAMGQISEFRKDRFLLDTKTGKVWSISVSGQTDFLMPIFFICGPDLIGQDPTCTNTAAHSFGTSAAPQER